MIKKPIKKLSYFNDLWVCIEYREYILKKEYDYPILDGICPEYIPKDIEDTAEKKGEILKNVIDENSSRFEINIDIGSPGIFYFALKPGEIITQLKAEPNGIIGDITCYKSDKNSIVYSFYNISDKFDRIYLSGKIEPDKLNLGKELIENPTDPEIQNRIMRFSSGHPNRQNISKYRLNPNIKNVGKKHKNEIIINDKTSIFLPNREFDFLYLLFYRFYYKNKPNQFVNNYEEISKAELQDIYGDASNVREDDYSWRTNEKFKRKSFDELIQKLKNDCPIIYCNKNYQIDPSIKKNNIHLNPY